MDTPWPRHDPDPRAQREQRFLIALAVSILIHAGILLIQVHESLGSVVAWNVRGDRPERLTVRLNHVAQPEPEAAVPPPKVRPLRPPRRQPSAPPILSVPTPQPSTPSVAAAPPQRNAPPVDMEAMVNAARALRRSREEAAARENSAAAARESGGDPSAREVADANLARNLQTLNKKEGVSGVFTILSMGTRTSTFAFRGWTVSERDSTRAVYEVDAGDLGNVQLATVKRMIQLIRTHYQGDFNWESHRLGRTVVMSARPADNAELEAFMLREFFDEQHR